MALVILAGLSLAHAVRAGETVRLLVLDQDAHATSHFNAGAVFNVVAPPVDAWISAELSAAVVPEIEYISALAVSPVDERVWIADRRALAADRGRIGSVECGTNLLESSVHAVLDEPRGLAFAEDGRLALVDADADPSGLGLDAAGGRGPGALFSIDTTTGAPSLLADGTLHSPLAGVPDGASVFVDPVSLAWASPDELVVVDRLADPLGLGHQGAVFHVDVTTGEVELLASHAAFVDLRSVTALPDGRVIAVDGLAGDSIVWQVEPAPSDPATNALALSTSEHYQQLSSVASDESGRIYLTDLGLFDAPTGRFLIRPSLWRLGAGGEPELLHRSDSGLITPIGLSVRHACPAPDLEGYAVSTRLLTGLPISEAFACGGEWPFCVAAVVSVGDLADDFVLPGRAAPETPGITFFSHAFFPDTRLSKDGDDLILSR
ncbi:MAG: hypothetical protein AAF533_14150 [Acidobacteriota bacterium]